MAIDRLLGPAAGMGVQFKWDATTALLFYSLGANTFHIAIWCDPGQIGPCPSLINGAGAGKTGKILIATVSAVANASYAITLWLRKTTA